MLLPLIIVFISLCITPSALSKEDAQRTDNVYARYNHMLQSVKQQVSVSLMKQYVTKIKHDVRPRMPTTYSRLIVEVVASLNEHEFNDQGQYKVAEQLAWQTIVDQQHLPIGQKVKLLLQLQSATGPTNYKLTNKSWPRERMVKAKIWLNTMREITTRIDPHWNPNDVPQLNVGLPPGASGFFMAGMDPNDIENPVVRKQYVAARMANAKKAKQYNEQDHLRYFKNRLFPVATRYLSIMFAHKPVKPDNVRALFRKYQVTDERANAIIAKVIAAKRAKEH